MKKIAAVLWLSCFACSFVAAQDVHVKNVPDFQREYRVHLGINGIVLVVKANRDWDGERGFLAELDQPDGKWVFFDIDRPADKIIDRDLLPSIVAACKKIRAMDRKFLGDGPKEITDQYWHKWVKVN